MPDNSNSEARKDVIPFVRVGNPLSAKQWNQLAKAIRDPLRGINGSSQTDYGEFPLAISQFVIIADDHGDFLTCCAWDSVSQTAGNDLVPVGKPYLLMQSTLDGKTDSNGIAYTFTDIDALTAVQSSTSTTENWEITQDYNIGDLIYAVGNPEGGIEAGNTFQWIDLNVDGRGWAKV